MSKAQQYNISLNFTKQFKVVEQMERIIKVIDSGRFNHLFIAPACQSPGFNVELGYTLSILLSHWHPIFYIDTPFVL